MTGLVTVRIGDTPEAAVTGTPLTGAHGVEFRDVANDVGLGALSLQADDGQLQLVDIGKYLSFSVSGTTVLTTRVEDLSPDAINADEESGALTRVSGRSLIAELEDATVQPENGMGRQPFSSARVFSFASPYFDDLLWDTAYEQFQQKSMDGPPTSLYGLPEDWPDPFIFWIWGAEYTGEEQEPAITYFRKTFTIETGGLHRFVCAGDNKFKAYIDGIEVLSYLENGNDGWRRLYDLDVELSEGEHVIAAVVENILGPSNAAGFLCGLWSVGIDGLGAKIVETDDTWKVLYNPAEPPGFTIGEIMLILLEEAEDAGLLPGGWTDVTGFSGTHDAKTDAWPILPEVSVQVGDDYLKVLKQFAESYVDFATNTSNRVLILYQKGNRGEVEDVDFTPGVNITELARKQVGTVKNVAHVLYKGGHVEIEDAEERGGNTSIELHGRRRAYLELQSFESLDAVNAYLAEWFKVYAWPHYSVTLGIEPAGGDIPFVDFGIADSIEVDGEELKVASITVTTDENGFAVYGLEVATLAELHDELLQRQLAAKASGTVGGRTLAASKTAPGVFGADRRIAPNTKRLQPVSFIGKVSNDSPTNLSGAVPIERPIRLTAIHFTGHGDGADDHSFSYVLNGSNQAPSVEPTATQTERIEFMTIDLVAGDVLQVECTAPADPEDGQTGVVITPRAYYV